MTPEAAFFTLHRDLPREGPGSPGDVLWALETARVPAAARICDAGCGPGADTATLAEARPEAVIEAIDKTPHFVAAARALCAGFGGRVRVRQGDIATPGGPFDFIWCAGAMYFLGVTEALRLWRGALAPGGRIAFSEPCLVAPPSDAVRAFWADYPAITDLAGIAARVAAAGFRVLAHRHVIGEGWRAYYAPMEARIAGLRPGADPALAQALDEAEAEIALWRAAPDEVAYALLIVAPA